MKCVYGRLYLYDRTETTIVDVKVYNSKKKRDAVIRDWQKMYGGAFKNCFVHISPETNDALIDDYGKNINRSEKPYSEMPSRKSSMDYVKHFGNTHKTRISNDTRSEYSEQR